MREIKWGQNAGISGKDLDRIPAKNKIGVNRYSLYNILSVKRMTLDITILIHFKETILNNNEIKPLWVTGFSDGESYFSVSILRNTLYKTGFVFIPSFSIELKDKDLDLLYKIQTFFNGVGKIHKIKSKGHAVYTVSSIKELEKIIIPHFLKYPLLTVKRVTFLLFKEIVNLMYNKRHLTKEGAQYIINMIVSMNNGRTNKFL